MFVPTIALLNDQPLESVRDCVRVLETYVLPHYQNETTPNVGYTKQQCYGVLASFFQAGKLNPHLMPYDIDDAVETFMDEKLWVNRDECRTAVVQHSFKPEVWFTYPLRAQLKDIVRMYLSLVVQTFYTTKVVFRLFLTDIVRLYKMTIYKMRGRR